MNLILHVWRQKSPADAGRMVRYEAKGVNPDMSFLEMLDVLNEDLLGRGEEPIAFDHDCREGICGMCGFMINGVAHGPQRGTTVCQLHMRHFKDGDELYLEPWRARAFPVMRDLVVNRSAFDRIIAAGGFISGADRQRTRRQRHPGSEAGRGNLDGRGGVHRMRRLRGGLSERFGVSVYGCKNYAPRSAAARPAGTPRAGAQDGGCRQRGIIRELHEHWRMQRSMPQVDSTGCDRADESGLYRSQLDQEKIAESE